MNERLKTWLDWEMKDFSEAFKEFNSKLNKKMPIWMAVSIIGMIVLGFCVGADVLTILKIHFPIGCAFALLIWLSYLLQGKTTSVKKVRDSYEKTMTEFFKSDDDTNAFLRQMDMRSYGKLNFLNVVFDKYPCRFIAGNDYWIFFKDLGCRFIRVDDIESIHAKEEKTRVRYSTSTTHVKQNVAVGVSLVIKYKENSVSASELQEEKLFFDNGEQYSQAIELIKKYCPKSSDFLSA